MTEPTSTEDALNIDMASTDEQPRKYLRRTHVCIDMSCRTRCFPMPIIFVLLFHRMSAQVL
jgi:hypothetical protein